MSDGPVRPAAVAVMVAAVVVMCVAGLAAVWLDDWRWAVTGLIVAVLLAAVSAAVEQRR